MRRAKSSIESKGEEAALEEVGMLTVLSVVRNESREGGRTVIKGLKSGGKKGWYLQAFFKADFYEFLNKERVPMSNKAWHPSQR